ncbi:PREDICTED: transmembrane protein 56 isoform X2 [Tinamus guttatus]|uniref:transmembrane protein 56 isoform X2 n=1 Tax=Tinamus guttatus TaxID=94827 RepID=UPI00052EF6A3|nr:PREDICTED: transmembrane protein 56 isoform X2 [Tinamus guttatus]
MASFSNLTVGIAVASFAVFQVLFHVLSSWVSTRITPAFNKLSQKRKIEWNSRGDPSIVKLNIAITTGYLISDLLLIIYYWKAIGDKYFVIHHLAALYAYSFVLSRGLLAYFANFRLLAEFSTPFVNQRWFFEVLGYPKSSKANIINGVLMTVVFFVVRIAVIPMYYSRVFSAFGTEAFERLGFEAQSAWIISSVVLDVMNVMWMVKITKGCYKVIRLIGREEAKTHKNGKSD